MAIQGNYSFEEQWNVLNLGTNGSVRVVIINKSEFSHPIHLHGHNFFVLYDSFIPYVNPVQLPKNFDVQRRDTQLMGPGYYLVVQYDTDNPGTWPLHCHIAWHLSGGLYMNMMEQVDDLRKVQLPSVVNQTCGGWDSWTANHVVHQIDSGLRLRE
jgi:FtsP/CotA-like multicopper oxidase with cupredoxin domain